MLESLYKVSWLSEKKAEIICYGKNENEVIFSNVSILDEDEPVNQFSERLFS